MSTEYSRYNDGSQNAPRLQVGHSLWSLIKLPMNAGIEWTLDEKFERVQAAGFSHVECWLDDENETEVCAALKRHNLRLILGHRPYTVEDTRSVVKRAKKVEAEFIFMQPASAFTPLEEVAKIVTEGRKIAADNGLPCFVECHRGNFTETLPQTLQLIERVPDIRFTADLSHFVVVGEFYGWQDEGALEKLRPVLERTCHAHGRISNGEQVQVDVGNGSGETAQFFVRLWAEAMRCWKRAAQPGDVFAFSSELGPPRYAITLPDGKEFSDRWQQSLVMKKLAEQAWELSDTFSDT
jgi:sugar phosphate isomerase/epimerase